VHTSKLRNWFLGNGSAATRLKESMDKPQLTGRNVGQVFNSRSGRMCAMRLYYYEAKMPNLKLKNSLKQLLGYLLSAFVLYEEALTTLLLTILLLNHYYVLYEQSVEVQVHGYHGYIIELTLKLEIVVKFKSASLRDKM
jgi:hypothetical protein